MANRVVTWCLFLLEIYRAQMTHHKSIIRHLNKSQTSYPNQISQITCEIYDQRMSPFTITCQRFKITLLLLCFKKKKKIFILLFIRFANPCFFFLLSLLGHFCLQDCKCILLFNSLIQFYFLFHGESQSKMNAPPKQ